jgi:excisionase family DNA binding protein
MPKWLTPPQVAAQLGVSLDVVYRWIGSGELRACDLAAHRGLRRRLRVHPDDLDAFLRRREVPPPQPRLPRRKRVEEIPQYV